MLILGKSVYFSIKDPAKHSTCLSHFYVNNFIYMFKILRDQKRSSQEAPSFIYCYHSQPLQRQKPFKYILSFLWSLLNAVESVAPLPTLRVHMLLLYLEITHVISYKPVMWVTSFTVGKEVSDHFLITL